MPSRQRPPEALDPDDGDDEVADPGHPLSQTDPRAEAPISVAEAEEEAARAKARAEAARARATQLRQQAEGAVSDQRDTTDAADPTDSDTGNADPKDSDAKTVEDVAAEAAATRRSAGPSCDGCAVWRCRRGPACRSPRAESSVVSAPRSCSSAPRSAASGYMVWQHRIDRA